MSIAIILAVIMLSLIAVFGTFAHPNNLGINIGDFTTADATARWNLGTRNSDDLTKEYVYVYADGSITAGDAVKISIGDANAPFSVVVATEVTDQAIGIAMATAVATNYIWIQVSGVYSNANVADAVAAGNLVVASATDGRLVAYDGTEVVTPLGQALEDGNGSNVADIYIFRRF